MDERFYKWNKMTEKQEFEVGNKLKCIKDSYNLFGDPLFLKDNTYEVLFVDDEITLNHILYANEFGSFSIDFVKEHFIFQTHHKP